MKESRGGEIREERRWKWVERKGGEKVEEDCIVRRVVQWKIDASLHAVWNTSAIVIKLYLLQVNWTRKLWSQKGSRHYRNTISLTNKLIAAARATGSIKVEPFPSVANSSTWLSHDTHTEPPQATQKRPWAITLLIKSTLSLVTRKKTLIVILCKSHLFLTQ